MCASGKGSGVLQPRIARILDSRAYRTLQGARHNKGQMKGQEGL